MITYCEPWGDVMHNGMYGERCANKQTNPFDLPCLHATAVRPDAQRPGQSHRAEMQQMSVRVISSVRYGAMRSAQILEMGGLSHGKSLRPKLRLGQKSIHAI